MSSFNLTTTGSSLSIPLTDTTIHQKNNLAELETSTGIPSMMNAIDTNLTGERYYKAKLTAETKRNDLKGPMKTATLHRARRHQQGLKHFALQRWYIFLLTLMTGAAGFVKTAPVPTGSRSSQNPTPRNSSELSTYSFSAAHNNSSSLPPPHHLAAADHPNKTVQEALVSTMNSSISGKATIIWEKITTIVDRFLTQATSHSGIMVGAVSVESSQNGNSDIEGICSSSINEEKVSHLQEIEAKLNQLFQEEEFNELTETAITLAGEEPHMYTDVFSDLSKKLVGLNPLPNSLFRLSSELINLNLLDESQLNVNANTIQLDHWLKLPIYDPAQHKNLFKHLNEIIQNTRELPSILNPSLEIVENLVVAGAFKRTGLEDKAIKTNCFVKTRLPVLLQVIDLSITSCMQTKKQHVQHLHRVEGILTKLIEKMPVHVDNASFLTNRLNLVQKLIKNKPLSEREKMEYSLEKRSEIWSMTSKSLPVEQYKSSLEKDAKQLDTDSLLMLDSSTFLPSVTSELKKRYKNDPYDKKLIEDAFKNPEHPAYLVLKSFTLRNMHEQRHEDLDFSLARQILQEHKIWKQGMTQANSGDILDTRIGWEMDFKAKNETYFDSDAARQRMAEKLAEDFQCKIDYEYGKKGDAFDRFYKVTCHPSEDGPEIILQLSQDIDNFGEFQIDLTFREWVDHHEFLQKIIFDYADQFGLVPSRPPFSTRVLPGGGHLHVEVGAFKNSRALVNTISEVHSSVFLRLGATDSDTQAVALPLAAGKEKWAHAYIQYLKKYGGSLEHKSIESVAHDLNDLVFGGCFYLITLASNWGDEGLKDVTSKYQLVSLLHATVERLADHRVVEFRGNPSPANMIELIKYSYLYLSIIHQANLASGIIAPDIPDLRPICTFSQEWQAYDPNHKFSDECVQASVDAFYRTVKYTLKEDWALFKDLLTPEVKEKIANHQLENPERAENQNSTPIRKFLDSKGISVKLPPLKNFLPTQREI